MGFGARDDVRQVQNEAAQVWMCQQDGCYQRRMPPPMSATMRILEKS